MSTVACGVAVFLFFQSLQDSKYTPFDGGEGTDEAPPASIPEETHFHNSVEDTTELSRYAESSDEYETYTTTMSGDDMDEIWRDDDE